MSHSNACAGTPRVSVVDSYPGPVVFRFWGPDTGQPAEWYEFCPWPAAPLSGPYVGGATQRWRWFARTLVDVWWPRPDAEPARTRAHFRVCWHLGLAAVFAATVLAVAFWLIHAPGAEFVELVCLAGAGVYLLALTIHARRLLR